MESLFGELSNRAQKNNKKIRIEEKKRMLQQEKEEEEIESNTELGITDKYDVIKKHTIQKRDLTAGQFYSSLQDMIQM